MNKFEKEFEKPANEKEKHGATAWYNINTDTDFSTGLYNYRRMEAEK
jgi:hypothetical protein